MKKYFPILTFLLVFFMFLGGQVSYDLAYSKKGKLSDQSYRQYQELFDSASFETVNGGRFNLTDIEAPIVILNFWASWCPPCRDETPHFEKIWRLYKEKDVVVIGINVQDDLNSANEYISEFDVTFVNGKDKNGRIMVDYGVTGLPVTFFLDREGMIIGRWVGSIGASSLESRVEALENGSFPSLYGSDKNKSGFRSLN